MERIQEIRDQIDQMQLKKVMFGGYSKEDVQLKMDMMFAMFEKAMKKQIEKQAEREAKLRVEYEHQIQELKDEFKSKKRLSDILISDLNKNISELTTQNQFIEEEKSKMQEANNTLTIQKQTLEEEQRRVQDMNTALNVEKHMMEEEQRKMQETNDALTAENEQMLQSQIQMKEAYQRYCRELLKEYSESLCSLSGEFSRILENVSNMQKEVDEESVFEGLEKAFEMKKQEVLTGTVEDYEEVEE